MHKVIFKKCIVGQKSIDVSPHVHGAKCLWREMFSVG